MRLRILALLALLPALALESAAAPAQGAPQDFLAGYDGGLFRVEGDGDKAVPLWVDGEVRKILRTAEGWYLLTSVGIEYSRDLGVFEDRSRGLPIKTYKRFEGGKKSFSTETQDLKDLEVDKADPLLLATCTKDAAFVSRDGGLTWKSYGTPADTTGLKAVALATYPGTNDAALWASHPIKGLFVRKLASGGWAPANAGMTMIDKTTVEEVADIVPGSGGSIWASNSFLSRVYRLDAKTKTFVTLWYDKADFGCAESLDLLPDGSLRFVANGFIARLDPAAGKIESDAEASLVARAAARAKPDMQALCVSWADRGRQSSLTELWLVAFKDRKPYRARAEGKRALYLSTGFVVHAESRAKYDKIMDDRRLDAVVVDMKDDFGRLRFEPRDPLVRSIGKVSSPLDVESFAKEWKVKGRYLIARIPVFKDEVAYRYAGGKYAVWDSASGGVGAPWQGYIARKSAPLPAAAVPAATAEAPLLAPPLAVSGTGAVSTSATASPVGAAAPEAPAEERSPVKEFWVDPYCEEIWAYNVAIANEIVARGFDEVQFDYIRFPTDGDNIGRASFRWKDAGMDKESALASFLRYARENIAAPISIDIYGANGWYRSGVRTGQDVELLAKYVDVICPMLYPSHFEQGFLAQAPAEMRPYRIYKIGTLRNTYIGRKKVVVRPYVQAFYMNVSYDRAYYDAEYVKREIAGVRDAMNLGLSFWNNAGRYDDIPILDIGPDGRLSTGAAVKAPSPSILD
jgi:hypothetical protein